MSSSLRALANEFLTNDNFDIIEFSSSGTYHQLFLLFLANKILINMRKKLGAKKHTLIIL